MRYKLIFGVVFLILLVGGIFAQTFEGDRGGSFSYSNAQYTQPGIFSLSGSGSQYYSPYMNSLSQEECSSSIDFLLKIPVGGCSPQVVRSDLLAEQNVAVFCKLQAIQINPTINPEYISTIQPVFIGEQPEEIAGIDFYRPRYTRVTRVDENSFPWYDNVGFLVIKLKQQPDEEDVDKFIQGNLTMRVRYTTSAGSSPGFIQDSIPVLSNSEWESEYIKYGFLDGQGFVRVDDVESNKIRVSVYRDKGTKIDSFNVPKEGSSGEKYLAGGYCSLGYEVFYEKSVIPEDKAVIYFNNDRYVLTKGEEFGEGCKVISIDSQGIGTGSVRVKCGSQTNELSIGYNKVNLEVEDGFSGDISDLFSDSSGEFNTGDVVMTFEDDKYYVGTIDRYASSVDSQQNNFVIIVKTNDFENEELQGELRTFANEVSYGNKEDKKTVQGIGVFYVISKSNEFVKLDDKLSLKFLGFESVENSNRGSEFRDYFNDAISDYEGVAEDYLDGKVFGLDESASKIALKDGLDLAEETKQTRTAIELANRLAEEYGDDVALNILNYIQGLDTTEAEMQVEIDGSIDLIRLDSIIEPGFEQVGVKLIVDGTEYKINRQGDTRVLNDGTSFKVEEFDEDSVLVSLSGDSCGDSGDKKQEKIKLGGSDIICGKPVFIDSINLVREAKIRIVPVMRNKGFETNISYGVGIESRAIKLSPEKSAEKIKKLNQSINDLEEINENLGDVVKTMKTACFATSAALQVKNLFTNLGGGAIARQEIMQGTNGWNSLCDIAMGNGGRPTDELLDYGMVDEEYSSFDDCIMENSGQINKEVEAYADIINDYNDELQDYGEAGDVKGQFEEHLSDLKSGTYGNVVDPDDSENLLDIDDVIEDLDYESATNTDLKEIDTLLRIRESDDATTRMKETADANLFVSLDRLNQLKSTNTDSIISDYSEYVNDDIKADVLTERRSKSKIYTGGTYKIGGEAKPAHIVSGEGGKYVIELESFGDNKYGKKNIYSLDENGEPSLVDCNSAEKESDLVNDCDLINSDYLSFIEVDSESYNNKYKDAEVRYHESGPYAGMPAIVPFDTRNGWYVATRPSVSAFENIAAFQDSGMPNSFTVCNVGKNGREEFTGGLGDDICRQFDIYTGQPLNAFPGLDERDARNLVSKATNALERAARQYSPGVTSVTIDGKQYEVGNPASGLQTRCTDFMSPSDCKLMFNVCDPVICPSSRCNLGGKYYVSDVVQTGIVGSVFLCLPNYKEGIFIPVCLTGIHAGIDNWISILSSYRDCLQESIDSGRYTGICDQITAVYKCEFFWKQITPLINNLLPKLLESLTGQGGVRGGGEYMNVQSAWSNMQTSIDYFTQSYGQSAFNAFKIRSTSEVGTEICKSFVSVSYPNKFEALVEPDSPTQFSAWFTETPQTTATVPAMSQYKVFFHIFAGNDQGVQYSVYLKDVAGPSFYDGSGSVMIDSGFISKGEYASKSLDKVYESNFQQLCVRINNQDKCGFKQVSTGFAVNYLRDKYAQSEIENTDISSADECISGSPNALALVQPNIQAGVEETINPQAYNRGIIRVCSSENPGESADSLRWVKVGTCGSTGMDCWLDKTSITDAIGEENVGTKNATMEYLNNLSDDLVEANELVILNDKQVHGVFSNIENSISQLKNKVNALENGEELGGTNGVLSDANDVFVQIASDEDSYDFSTTQQARLDLFKARVSDLLARAAFNVYVSNQQDAESADLVEEDEEDDEDDEDEEDEERGVDMAHPFVKTAFEEYSLWDKGKLEECDDEAKELLRKYWDAANYGANWNCDRDPWSAAFISYVVKQSGIRFPYSASHSTYFTKIRDNSEDYDCSTRKISNQVSVGELVCNCRSNGCPTSYDEVEAGDLGHCAIVYEKTSDFMKVISGNRENTVLLEEIKFSDLENLGYYGIISCEVGDVIDNAGEQEPEVEFEEISNDVEDKLEIACPYFERQRYSDEQIAGIFGNLIHESQLDSDAENSNGAYGIAQWLGSRKDNLVSYADSTGSNLDSFNFQLKFIQHELNGKSSEYGGASQNEAYFNLILTESVEDATKVFMEDYERPGDDTLPKRVMYAEQVYDHCFG